MGSHFQFVDVGDAFDFTKTPLHGESTSLHLPSVERNVLVTTRASGIGRRGTKSGY